MGSECVVQWTRSIILTDSHVRIHPSIHPSIHPFVQPLRIPALEAALEALGRTLSSSPGCGGKRAAMNDEVDAVLRSFAPSVGESAALCKVLDACALEAHRGEIDAAFVPPGGGGVEGSEEGVEGIVRRLEGMERGGSEWAGKVREDDVCGWG